MTNATFDFDNLDLSSAAEKPFEFELRHPENKKGLGVFVSVIGMESATFQRYVRDEGNRVREKAFRQGPRDDKPMTIDEEEETLIRALAVCVVGWRTVIEGKSEPVIFWRGDKLECSPANAAKWMQHFRWVREQVNAAASDIGNFIGD